MTRSGRPGLGSKAEAGAALFLSPFGDAAESRAFSIGADADAPPYAPLRPARRAWRAARSIRRLGDAGAVRRRHPGASRGPQRQWRLRRLAHGRARGGGRGRARLPAGGLVERSRKTRPGQAQYTLLTNEQGGIVDDLIVYERDPE